MKKFIVSFQSKQHNETKNVSLFEEKSNSYDLDTTVGCRDCSTPTVRLH